jgi:hypothetical protein
VGRHVVFSFFPYIPVTIGLTDTSTVVRARDVISAPPADAYNSERELSAHENGVRLWGSCTHGCRDLHWRLEPADEFDDSCIRFRKEISQVFPFFDRNAKFSQ